MTQEVAEVMNSSPGFAIRRPENSPCQPSSKWTSNMERIKQRKERDLLRYSGTLTPTAPMATRLWEAFTLSFYFGYFQLFARQAEKYI